MGTPFCSFTALLPSHGPVTSSWKWYSFLKCHHQSVLIVLTFGGVRFFWSTQKSRSDLSRSIWLWVPKVPLLLELRHACTSSWCNKLLHAAPFLTSGHVLSYSLTNARWFECVSPWWELGKLRQAHQEHMDGGCTNGGCQVVPDSHCITLSKHSVSQWPRED